MNMFGSSTKPTASLSSGLLARKGQARPAMRPQGFVGYAPQPSTEDLGWNDMGHDVPPLEPAPVPPAAAPVVPPVLRQRETLAAGLVQPVEMPEAEIAKPEVKAEVIPQPEPKPVAAPRQDKRNVSPATAQRLQRETRRKAGKAAFTLRLDGDRHLRLRLASAVRGESAQTLVTEALDAFLNAIPEIEALASQLPDRVGSKARGK